MTFVQVLPWLIAGLIVGSLAGVRFSIHFIMDHAFAAAIAAGADRHEYLMQLGFQFGKLAAFRRIVRDASPSKCDQCGWMREPKLEWDKRHQLG